MNKPAFVLVALAAAVLQVHAEPAKGGGGNVATGKPQQYDGGNAYAARAKPMPEPMPSDAPPPLADTKAPVSVVQGVIKGVAPLDEAQMRELMQAMYQRMQAAGENFSGQPPARPVVHTETLDLSPGAIPPVIRVSRGQGATISFTDAAGRPWPLEDNLSFNDRAIGVKMVGPHLYTVSALSSQVANLVIVLKGLPRPIVLTVLPAAAEVDYLREFIVPKFINDQPPPGDLAATNVAGGLSHNAPELLNYLYRTPPAAAKSLAVNGLDGVLAWQNTPQRMVIRTRGMVVIPGWIRRHTSSDGMAVYELPLSPVVTVVQDGRQHRVRVEGFSVPGLVTQSPASVVSGAGPIAATATPGGGSAEPVMARPAYVPEKPMPSTATPGIVPAAGIGRGGSAAPSGGSIQ